MRIYIIRAQVFLLNSHTHTPRNYYYYDYYSLGIRGPNFFFFSDPLTFQRRMAKSDVGDRYV